MRLPRIGAVRTKEPTARLAERLGEGGARILSVTVSEGAGRWNVSFGRRGQRPEALPARTDAVVGVDVGVRSLAVVSTGEVVANPWPTPSTCPATPGGWPGWDAGPAVPSTRPATWPASSRPSPVPPLRR
ncbi:MAG: hypothetical protein ACRDY0_06710 [Acidimicrobiales bacterium]